MNPLTTVFASSSRFLIRDRTVGSTNLAPGVTWVSRAISYIPLLGVGTVLINSSMSASLETPSDSARKLVSTR